MARLNDTAAPIDPVELLRRKYSRQNKEIARINSTQCIRIRNLENEVSRLLTENLDLREQILHLQTEAESRSSQGIIDHVNNIKANLEAKLLELGKLVTDLDMPPPKRKTSVYEGRNLRASPKQSPDQKTWKNMYTLSEAVGLDDGKLPPILEDKCYPRRTLEPSEIHDIFSDNAADNTDSPDIGPPPVSQFINEDPLKIDLPKNSETANIEKSEADPTSSINLEQRRKRRDSSTLPEQKRASRFETESGQPGKEVAQSLKIGAKRKLSTREDEDGAITTKNIETSPDDFKYTRRSTEEQSQRKTLGVVEKSAGKSQREIATAKGFQREKTSSTATITTRRALGPKTANIDVASSPRKNHKHPAFDEQSSEKGGSLRKDTSKERPRERKVEPLRIKTTDEPIVASADIVLEPETPAAPNIFSPPASGSSGIRAESRDTPPPSDLGSGIEGQRPSRRSKGSVSYAEPNLRDKMRRPTKELVDAVTGEGKAQRLSNVKLEGEDPISSIKLKEELGADDSWKTLPSASMVNEYSRSPLGNKVSPKEEIPRALTAQRHRRRSSIHQANDSELPRSGSGSAISALLNGPRKYRHEQSERNEAKESLNKAMAKLDIYEFTGSSPREPSDSRIPAVKADWQSGRDRRTSSVTQELDTGNAPESSDGEQTSRGPTSSSRRRQSMIGARASASNIEADGQRQADDLGKPNNQSRLNDGLEPRSDRLSARRRSMML